ncbi:alpha/beta-hydrolase [Penicillium riverlandense]|uniref:alpha/beta-hydrolase n=1 Tax=Penicillium riverlandense TaxID=1903569 RepID=UPI002546E610|nr:alpha/beta-hydrolase [Penicillium riverlandense]KAJ5818508.1 alpha/beta-hydrolase [Penicillium riverlandense]
MHAVSADGTNIFAEAIGNSSNPAVVFIHGFSSSGLVFEKQFSNTTLQANLYLIRYDMRGHGRSDQPTSAESYTSQLFAEDFKAVCKAFNVTKPFLAGWSFGGTIGADICANLGPEYLSGEILLSSVPYGAAFIQVGKGNIVPILQTLGSPTTTSADYAKAVSDFVDSCVAPGFAIPVETKWLWMGAVLAQKPAVRPLLRGRTQDPAALIDSGLPLLVIQGGCDVHLNAEKLRDLVKEKFDSAEYHTFEGVGHMPFYERVDETNKLILEFVIRCKSA